VDGEQKEEMSLFIERNKELYELLEKATSMPKCRFPINYEDGPGMLLPHLAKLRMCARLLAVKSAIEAANGQTEKALHICISGIKLAQSVSNEPVLISSLVRIAIDSMMLSSLEEISNKGTVDNKSYKKLVEEIKKERESPIVSSGLKNEVVGALWVYNKISKSSIEEILDMFTPRLYMSGPETKPANPNINSSNGNKIELNKEEKKLIKEYIPFVENDIVFYLQTISSYIFLAKGPYWQVKDSLRKTDESINTLRMEKYFLSMQLLPALSRAHLQEARIDALLGAAQMGLANRIYRQEHGEFVDSLSQLTPDILPALPLDPFTGKDYIYRKKDKGFVVYSVGEDEKDYGGVEEKGLKPDIVWEDKGLEGRYQRINSAGKSEAENTNKMQNEALRQLIEALNTNYSKIKDISVEYKTETINKGMEKSLHEGSYKWFKKGDKQRIEYFWGAKKDYYTIKIFTGEKIIAVSQAPNRPREITFMGEGKKDLGERNHAFEMLHYNETAPSGFLSNIHDESIPDALQKYATEVEIQGKYANVVLEIPNMDQKFKVKIDIEKGIPLSIHRIDKRGSFSEFVVTEPMEEGGIWFMKKGVLHRYGWHKKDSGELYSKNEQDAFVEIEKIEFNTGLSDSLFNIIPQKDDEAYEIRQGIPISYFLSEEQKEEVVKRVSEKRRKIESLYGKPAPELEIEKWINHEPDVEGKKRLYVFVNQVSGNWWLEKFNKPYKVLRDLIEVVVICRSGNTEDLEKLVENNEIMFPVGVDKEGATFKKYFITSSTDGYTIDENGVIVNRGLSQFLGNHVGVPENLEKAYRESLK